VASHLIANGADINKEVAHVGTPLICAAGSGQKNMVKLLIEKGADPNKWVMHVGSPLSIAKENGHEEIAAFLRAKGALD
jgi:ankyrin repeat protein